ncbi:L,D-transpeptidase [Aureimonas psammosilenae]|uniref:L,D-transpeptidase n=1 Tax=Aureimonas psammosilenae TaxID=2495496 RepID=UPI00126079E1|nr:L,D-transpeptidase [Aureimonas psammosilenae]
MEEFHPRELSRRSFLTACGIGVSALATGCMSGGRARIADSAIGPAYYSPANGGAGYSALEPMPGAAGVPAEYVAMYGPIEDEGFLIPGIDFTRVDQRYLRRVVPDPTGAAPGTITIDTAGRFAYLSQGGGTAMRYGVGIGRQGFSWEGDAVVQWKRKWPRWTPPTEMIARQPELEVYRDGMEAGLKNPLGARALYLFHNGQDTLYRLHGTPEYWTIGHAVSSGCVRFMNHDIIDLYDRVPNASKVVVIQGGGVA